MKWSQNVGEDVDERKDGLNMKAAHANSKLFVLKAVGAIFAM